MEFARSCIRVLAAIALLAMGVHFAPIQTAAANDHGSLSAVFDGAHRTDVVTLVEQTSVAEITLDKQDCPPLSPTKQTRACPGLNRTLCKSPLSSSPETESPLGA